MLPSGEANIKDTPDFTALGNQRCQNHFLENYNSLVQGIGAGLWSGLASGVLACSMALGMIVFGMGFITHDPLNIQEWAVRGSSGVAPTMAAYFAYETLTGAFGHLVVLESV